MKFIISSFVVALSLLTQMLHAQQTITYDSLAVDAFQVPQIVEDSLNILGFANNSNVVLNNGSYFVLAQFYHGSSTPIEFQVGSKIEFYWTRATNDSSRAWFVLRHYIVNENGWINPDGPGDTAFVTQAKTTLPQMYTLTVQHAGYNTVEVWPDTALGTKPVYIDAIVLKQHGTITINGSGVKAPLPEAVGFTCTPNPFVATQGTTLHSIILDEGFYIPAAPDRRDGYFVVMDLLGREVATLEARKDIHISVPNNGTYFVRYRLGGHWVGNPFRIIAE